jgi:hypothetical protein
MAATAQAQAEALKATQRAGIEHAKQNAQRAYLGRKPSFTREQLVRVRSMLRQPTAGIAQIGKETGLTDRPSTELRMTLRVQHRRGITGTEAENVSARAFEPHLAGSNPLLFRRGDFKKGA